MQGSNGQHMNITEVKKTLYDKIAAQPRLFEGEAQLQLKKKQSTDVQSQINEQKYRQFMDRAFMEMEKTNQQLQNTRQELQQAGKNLSSKDQQINALQAEMQRLQAQYQKQFDENGAALAAALKQRELDMQKQYDDALKAREAELLQQQQLAQEELEKARQLQQIDTGNNYENFSMSNLTPRTRQKLVDEINEQLRQKQLYQLNELTSRPFPRTYKEVVELVKYDEIKGDDGHYNVPFSIEAIELQKNQAEGFDFLGADVCELPENIQQYYHIKDLELEITQQEQLIAKPKQKNSNIEDSDEHSGGQVENLSNVL